MNRKSVREERKRKLRVKRKRERESGKKKNRRKTVWGKERMMSF